MRNFIIRLFGQCYCENCGGEKYEREFEVAGIDSVKELISVIVEVNVGVKNVAFDTVIVEASQSGNSMTLEFDWETEKFVCEEITLNGFTFESKIK